VLPDSTIDEDRRHEKQLVNFATNDKANVCSDEFSAELPPRLSGAENALEFIIHVVRHVWLTTRFSCEGAYAIVASLLASDAPSSAASAC
jgi:hypothetical protein